MGGTRHALRREEEEGAQRDCSDDFGVCAEYEQSTAQDEGNEEDDAVLVSTGAAEVKRFDERPGRGL